MNAKVILIVALCGVPLAPTAAFAQVPPEFQGRGCNFYMNEDGGGQSVDFDVTLPAEGSNGTAYARYAPILGERWDNKISAVRCDHHCNAVLYDQTYRQGPEIATPDFQSGLYNMGGRGSNDRASSLAVFCTR